MAYLANRNISRAKNALFIGADYRLEWKDKLKVDNAAAPQEFKKPKQILYLRYKRIFELYLIHGKKIGEPLLPKNSLAYYLEHSPAYLGKRRSYRFKNIIQGYTQTTVVQSVGSVERKEETTFDQAYCFDYEMIVEQYGVNLDISFDDLTNDE